jgi:hypothetical protein
VVSAAEPEILPTLFGEGYGLYKIRGRTFLLSFLVHVLAIVLLLVSSRLVATRRHEIRQQVIGIVTEVSPYILPPSASKAGGGGGGGIATSCEPPKESSPAFLANNWLLQ